MAALSTELKWLVNRLLNRFNLRLDTLTAEQVERRRLAALERAGAFDMPVFPVPPGFAKADHAGILAAVDRYAARLADFGDPARNEVGFSYANHFFSSPDAEVLYTLVRELRPKTVLEIGSGNSTRVMRQAIRDAGLHTRLVAVDPCPRVEIADFVDEQIAQPVERLPLERLAALLEPGALLFIDSSHEVKAGGDVPFLLLRLLPLLPPGVIVHIHDVFLPYEYPRRWVVEERYAWAEQYLVQAMLAYGERFEVLWAGQYAQRSTPDFAAHFPHATALSAQSLWLRTRP